jgi:hypothetical protein
MIINFNEPFDPLQPHLSNNSCFDAGWRIAAKNNISKHIGGMDLCKTRHTSFSGVYCKVLISPL